MHLRRMKVQILFLVGILTLKDSLAGEVEDTDTYLSRFLADLWLEGADVVKIIWRDCSKKLADVKDSIETMDYYPKFTRCMKRKTLRALDRSLSLDVVPIADGVNLVKFEMVDRSGNVIHENNSSTWSEKDLNETDWRTLALQRIVKVLRTHVVKFDLDEFKTMEGVEQRGRRRHHMMTMMMFGIVSIGMVLIPMGFQFLAVLGGKALLLAKMALILASIQGLKKIASSPLNYGFYHNYYPYDHLDKRSNDGALLTGTSPIAKQQWPIKPYKNIRPTIHRGEIYDKQTNNGIRNPISTNSKENYVSRQFPNNDLYSSSSLQDITSRPGEVQADYSLELPYNGLNFQSPNTVVST
ncbi:uncharacterized protein LOC123692965 [Colias croceus]|uniref:uncharacterized protein LOC123692965 n=1 Tax=Colias crocea TaxID=72248 RepID=UPI001E27DC3E|nr:uncharacterized protein LOC123692965 [Colias croceus]